VIEITLEDDSRIIVNRHSSAQELWIAARSGGYHFRHTPGDIWIDTRTGEEFFAALARCLSEQSGESVILDLTGPN
jgi:CyaY protein